MNEQLPSRPTSAPSQRFGANDIGNQQLGATNAGRWTQISLPVQIGMTARRQFLWFLGLSTVAVFLVGSHAEGSGYGIFLVLIYLFVIPGMLGLGWFLIFGFWVAWGMVRDEKKTLLRVRRDFEECAKGYGELVYMDVSLDSEMFTGLALAGTSLLVVQDGEMRKVLKHEVRSWRWQIDTASQLTGSTDPISRIEFRGKEKQMLEKKNGFFLLTFDPMRPELQLRTSNEEVCRRWEVIVENIAKGRTAAD